MPPKRPYFVKTSPQKRKYISPNLLANNYNVLQVIIDSVSGLKILDWWQPQYQRIEEFITVDSQAEDLFGL